MAELFSTCILILLKSALRRLTLNIGVGDGKPD